MYGSLWSDLADVALSGDPLHPGDAIEVLKAPDDELLDILHSAFRVRQAYHGRSVRVHVLQNAKLGACPEDCGFCSQSSRHDSGVGRAKLQTVDEIVAGAREAAALGAVKYCIVTATRGPSERDLDTICTAVEQIKAECQINICTSLGLLKEGQAERLKAAGVTRFNHNLESSREYFGEVVTSHTWDDRVATVQRAKAAGLEACCGGIMGMGESLDDRVNLAYSLRELEVESIPVNFLDPRPGTPMADRQRMTPAECLKTLAMMRFVNPTRDIRIAGGREVNLRNMQALALYPANSLFVDGYLTTPGAGAEHDLQMIRDAGFEVAEMVAAG
jgi:biotin synthase